jgi:hypothetical protein
MTLPLPQHLNSQKAWLNHVAAAGDDVPSCANLPCCVKECSWSGPAHAMCSHLDDFHGKSLQVDRSAALLKIIEPLRCPKQRPLDNFCLTPATFNHRVWVESTGSMTFSFAVAGESASNSRARVILTMYLRLSFGGGLLQFEAWPEDEKCSTRSFGPLSRSNRMDPYFANHMALMLHLCPNLADVHSKSDDGSAESQKSATDSIPRKMHPHVEQSTEWFCTCPKELLDVCRVEIPSFITNRWASSSRSMLEPSNLSEVSSEASSLSVEPHACIWVRVGEWYNMCLGLSDSPGSGSHPDMEQSKRLTRFLHSVENSHLHLPYLLAQVGVAAAFLVQSNVSHLNIFAENIAVVSDAASPDPSEISGFRAVLCNFESAVVFGNEDMLFELPSATELRWRSIHSSQRLELKAKNESSSLTSEGGGSPMKRNNSMKAESSLQHSPDASVAYLTRHSATELSTSLDSSSTSPHAHSGKEADRQLDALFCQPCREAVVLAHECPSALGIVLVVERDKGPALLRRIVIGRAAQMFFTSHAATASSKAPQSREGRKSESSAAQEDKVEDLLSRQKEVKKDGLLAEAIFPQLTNMISCRDWDFRAIVELNAQLSEYVLVKSDGLRAILRTSTAKKQICVEDLQVYRDNPLLELDDFGVFYKAESVDFGPCAVFEDAVVRDPVMYTTRETLPAHLWRYDSRIAKWWSFPQHPNVAALLGVQSNSLSAFGKNFLNVPVLAVMPPFRETLLQAARKLGLGPCGPAANDFRTALSVLRDIARGLEHVHRHGFSHRNISADAMLIRPGGAGMLLLYDLDKSMQSAPEAFESILCSPEIFRTFSPDLGLSNYSQPSDVWSFGMSVLQLVDACLRCEAHDESSSASKSLVSLVYDAICSSAAKALDVPAQQIALDEILRKGVLESDRPLPAALLAAAGATADLAEPLSRDAGDRLRPLLVGCLTIDSSSRWTSKILRSALEKCSEIRQFASVDGM